MRERLKAIMAQVFGVEGSEIPDDISFGNFDGWDSLGHISLMMGIEQEFGVKLTTESMQKALTIPAIEDFIRAGSTAANRG